MGKPVVIEIIARDGASKVLRPVVDGLRDMDDAGSAAQAGTAKAGTGVVDLATKVGGLATAYLGFSQVSARVVEGFTLTATLDQNQRMLSTLMGSVQKGSAVFDDASKFARQYGYTQRDMGQAAQEAAGIFKQTNQTTEKTLEVLGRLGSLNAGEGISGATVALKELISLDVTSLAERFNISKAAANEMKDAIAAGADPVVVLDAALNKMGVTAAVLTERMEGPNGAALRLEQANENLTLSIGRLLQTMNAPEAVGFFAQQINNLATGIEQVSTGLSGSDMMMNQVNTMALQAGASYEKYYNALKMVGDEQYALSESGYKLAEALVSQGMSFQEAALRAREINDVLAEAKDGGDLTAASFQNLSDRMYEVAAMSPTTAAAVKELGKEMVEGEGSGMVFAAILEIIAAKGKLKEDQDYASAEATFYASEANAEAGYTADVLAAQFENLTGMTYEQSMAQIEAGLQAEAAARYQEDLAWASDLASGGAIDAAAAALYLHNAYGLEIEQALKLTAATNELNKSRAGGQGKLLAGAAAAALGRITDAPGGAAGTHARNVGRVRGGTAGAEGGRAAREAPRRSGGSGSGGGAGKKAGKSDAEKEAEREAKELKKIQDRMAKEEEKFNDKMLKLDEQHIANEKKIWDDYYAKQLAALTKFNADKFKDELSFKDSLKGMDAAARAAMIAEERKAWDEAQAIAQAGNPKLADEYYKLKLDQIKANQERADELTAIERQISEETDAEQKRRLEQERAYLLQLDAEHDKYDAEDLQKLKDGGDQLAQERDEQLREEEQRYAEAGATLKEEYAKNVADIVEEGGKIGQAFADIATAAQAAAEAARAAVDSIPSAPSGADAPGGGGDAPAPDGSYALGLKRVPRDGFIAELHEDERILTANEARDYNRREAQGGIRDNPSRAIGGGGTGGGLTIGSITIAPTFPGSSAPRRDIDAAKADLKTFVLDILDKKAQADTRIGRGGGFSR